MARARNIKPGFFTNEDLAECSPWARLLFAGLWLLADREGRLEDRPKRIKGQLFAYDSIEVEPLLVELADRSFIMRYRTPDGRSLIQVVEFLTHQNPHHREPQSDLPPPQSPGLPPDGTTAKPQAEEASDEAKAQGQPRASPGPAQGFDAMDVNSMGSKPCGFRIPDSGALIPERVATAADQPLDPPRTVPAAAASAKRGIRLALEWVLPPDWGDWAMAEFPHWGPDIVRQLADGFRDHWVAKPGADATKLDWLATWRNWCRSDIAQRQHPKPKGEVLRPDFLRELR